jgi:hypothetical protein
VYYFKAVVCPTDLGLESNCTRLIDDVSCHCASFTKVDNPIYFYLASANKIQISMARIIF